MWRPVASVPGMTWLGTLWWLVGALTDAGPAGLAGVLLVAAVAAVLLLARQAPASDPGIAGLALRHRAERAGVPRHRDPDAPGRTRPRGPTARPPVAAA